MFLSKVFDFNTKTKLFYAKIFVIVTLHGDNDATKKEQVSYENFNIVVQTVTHRITC